MSHSCWHGGFRKTEMVFDQDAAADAVFVLQSGLVKLIYRTENGDEWVKSFVVDAGVFAPQSLDGPASYAAVCLEASHVVQLPMGEVAGAMEPDSGLSEAYRNVSTTLRQLVFESQLSFFDQVKRLR